MGEIYRLPTVTRRKRQPNAAYQAKHRWRAKCALKSVRVDVPADIDVPSDIHPETIRFVFCLLISNLAACPELSLEVIAGKTAAEVVRADPKIDALELQIRDLTRRLESLEALTAVDITPPSSLRHHGPYSS